MRSHFEQLERGETNVQDFEPMFADVYRSQVSDSIVQTYICLFLAKSQLSNKSTDSIESFYIKFNN